MSNETSNWKRLGTSISFYKSDANSLIVEKKRASSHKQALLCALILIFLFWPRQGQSYLPLLFPLGLVALTIWDRLHPIRFVFSTAGASFYGYFIPSEEVRTIEVVNSSSDAISSIEGSTLFIVTKDQKRYPVFKDPKNLTSDNLSNFKLEIEKALGISNS